MKRRVNAGDAGACQEVIRGLSERLWPSPKEGAPGCQGGAAVGVPRARLLGQSGESVVAGARRGWTDVGRTQMRRSLAVRIASLRA